MDFVRICCCKCGAIIESNPLNMCEICLKSEIDITEGITKSDIISYCSKCERYLQPPNQWFSAALESKELLSFCLKKLKGLKKVRLVDAGFIWTEPHSRQIKLKLTIQKEVQNGAIMQQDMVVDFKVHNYQCPDCHHIAAKDYWRACVQVRQKADHKKTLYYLEQVILKYGAHKDTLSLKPAEGGMDFFFAQKSHALSFCDFVCKKLPCSMESSKELLSEDKQNNEKHYKFSYSIRVPPVCKDDLVCLPKSFAQRLGNMGQLCLVYRVTDNIHLIDPHTCQVAEIDGKTYWSIQFKPIATCKQLHSYIVIDAEVDHSGYGAARPKLGAGHAPLSLRHGFANAYVIKMNNPGEQIHVRTHLGFLLQPGDNVMGYDIRNSNVNNEELDKINPESVPDVILVKKVYPERSKAAKRRWKLQRLAAGLGEGSDGDSANRDYANFQDDLEEDEDLRRNVNIYKRRDIANRITNMNGPEYVEDGAPQIPLEEMLDELNLGGFNEPECAGEFAADVEMQEG